MTDVTSNFYPARFVDSAEPGLVAAYTFSDGELAQFGRYINRAATGAAYDLTTRTGTPLVGQGGGIYGNDGLASCYYPSTVHAGARLFEVDIDIPTFNAVGNFPVVYYTGVNNGIYKIGNQIYTFFQGGTFVALGVFTGRGPHRLTGYNNGALTVGLVNGVRVGSVVSAVTGSGLTQIGSGFGGNVLSAKVGTSTSTWTDEQIRASYVRDFARRILWQWQGRDVGEGPAGGILTGAVSGVGGWTCPLGAATMQFVWRPDLSIPGGGRLCLTDSNVGTMQRIDFEYGSRPWFGSWLIEAQVRDPLTDSLRIGWTPMRGVDFTAAGSNSYWMHVRMAPGPWFRASAYLANGAQIDAVDCAFPGPVANDRIKILLTRDVDGTIQTYMYVQSFGQWFWSAAVGNDVSVLSEGCVSIAARGAYVERVRWMQGAMTPHELEAVVP